jgi:hypothetical protein
MGGPQGVCKYYLKKEFLVHRKHTVSITKDKQLMLFWEITAIYSVNHTKSVQCTLWAKCRIE